MILFWGWGKESVERMLGPTERVVLVFSYFHLWWVLRAAWGREFYLATWTEAGWAVAPVTAETALDRCAGNPPEIPLWQRFSMLWGAAGVALLVALIGVTSQLRL